MRIVSYLTIYTICDGTPQEFSGLQKDGVLFVDPDYFEKEGIEDKKDVGEKTWKCLGLLSTWILWVWLLYHEPQSLQEHMQVFAKTRELKPQLMMMLRIRLMKKLGDNTYLFIFVVPQQCQFPQWRINHLIHPLYME
ncbi:uncharacterized protein [Dysidea avara]|uniref:uncharacterized protein isoform X4 n=1 Tax=Dysidea avara TaxID=196820 RepID=UPI0033267D62